MTKKELVKAGAKLIVSVGVGTIVTNAVAFTTPMMTMGVLKRACIGVGSFALSLYTSDKVTDYTDEKLEEVFAEVSKAMSENEDKEEKKEATT